jgi:hypothetical protein
MGQVLHGCATTTETNLPHDWKEQRRFLGFAA